ncbi:MAG: hypothetical protein NDJ72_09505 [Elusimicrobia bacterium]|nr:hypothetical protein [Elusimicrobiota bacterium]
MSPERDRLAPRLVRPAPAPSPADRLCASTLIARLNAASDQSDAAIFAAAAQAVMELRHSITKAAHAAFLEKQAEIDDELRRAVRAFLADLRASGGPDERPPDESDPAQRARFVALLGNMAAAVERKIEVRP